MLIFCQRFNIIDSISSSHVFSRNEPAILYSILCVGHHLFSADLTKIDCAKGWLSTDGSCYKISESRRTWTAAQRKCSALSKQHGMPAGAQISLASIHNAQDHIRVVQALMAASKKLENVTNFWIGLSDRANESNFEWTDGSAIDYLPWSIGEPNDYGHHQDCVQIKGAYGYLFNDASCSQQFYYVCGHSRCELLLTLLSFSKGCAALSETIAFSLGICKT